MEGIDGIHIPPGNMNSCFVTFMKYSGTCVFIHTRVGIEMRPHLLPLEEETLFLSGSLSWRLPAPLSNNLPYM